MMPITKRFTEENNLTTEPITEDILVSYNIENKGCITSPMQHKVHWRLMPDANYDYQVTWRDVTFASRLISQGDYIWEFDDGTDTSMGTDVEHHYYNDGDYNVSLMVVTPFDCIDTVTKTVTINSVGIEQVSTQLFNVYPNPNNGNFTINVLNADQPMSIDIMDLKGRRIADTTIPAGITSHQMNLETLQLAEGVYLLHATQGDETMVYRVVIK